MMVTRADSRIGYKSCSNLVEFAEMEVSFEEKIKEFENSFQQDEIWETIIIYILLYYIITVSNLRSIS
jgi:hypothetical protein